MNFGPIGRFLIITGAAIILLGVAFLFFEKIPLLGRLPGDIAFKKKNFSFYFPLGTSILLSIIVSVILYIVSVLKR